MLTYPGPSTCSPSTTMSRPAIALAAEAMRPDARCEIVEQMRQLLETAQALLCLLLTPSTLSTLTLGRPDRGPRRHPNRDAEALSLPFSRSRYLGTGCGPWSWASDTTDTQRGPPWLRAESPTSGFQCTEAHAPTGTVDVGGTARRQELTPLADRSDDGGRRPSASRRFGLRRVAPPVLAPGRPSPGRGGCGPRGSR